MPLYEWFRVVVSFPTNRAKAFLHSFVSLKPLKVFQTGPMIHMTATQDVLILKLQIFEADWAWLVHLTPLKEITLNKGPLYLAKGLRRLFNKT